MRTNTLSLFKPVHQELSARYQEFFESKLALTLLKNPLILATVKKISTAILTLIEKNRSLVISHINLNPKIKEELYGEQFFGRLIGQAPSETDSLLTQMENVLKGDHANLAEAMQIHAIFIHRLYDKLGINSVEKEKLAKLIFTPTLFDPKNRGRVELPHSPLPTRQLGIGRNPVFNKMVGQDSVTHIRALEKFAADHSAAFFKSLPNTAIPFAAGVSGHTGSLLLGAQLYGALNAVELNQYALACFAFLAAGGNHSFHEVMMVAHPVGVPFEANHYALSIPDAIKATAEFERLQQAFPEFLDAPAAPQCTAGM